MQSLLSVTRLNVITSGVSHVQVRVIWQLWLSCGTILSGLESSERLVSFCRVRNYSDRSWCRQPWWLYQCVNLTQILTLLQMAALTALWSQIHRRFNSFRIYAVNWHWAEFLLGMYRILALANLASDPFWKSGQIRLRSEFWRDLGQLSRTVIFLTTANSTGTYDKLKHLASYKTIFGTITYMYQCPIREALQYSQIWKSEIRYIPTFYLDWWLLVGR